MTKQRRYHSVVRERSAAATRSFILEAAASVFASNGYASTTVIDIAAQAQVGVATVYSVFGAKAHLLAALIEQAVEDSTINVVPEAIAEATTGPVVIREVADAFKKNSKRWYSIYELGVENSRTDPIIKATMDECLKTLRYYFAAAADRLMELDVVKPELDHAEAAHILWFYFGPAAWHSLIDTGWSYARSRDFLIDQASRALLRRGRPASRRQD